MGLTRKKERNWRSGEEEEKNKTRIMKKGKEDNGRVYDLRDGNAEKGKIEERRGGKRRKRTREGD